MFACGCCLDEDVVTILRRTTGMSTVAVIYLPTYRSTDRYKRQTDRRTERTLSSDLPIGRAVHRVLSRRGYPHGLAVNHWNV